MIRGSREWNRACLVHSMLYSHLPYILFTAFFSESQNPSPGALGRVSGALAGLHEAIPAHGSCPRTWCGAWGRMVAVSGTCRGHIRVHGTRTAVWQAPGSARRYPGESGGGARRSKDGLSTGYQAFATLPRTHRFPPRRLNDEPMPHTDAVTALPRGTVSRQRGRLRPPRCPKHTRSVRGTP